MEPLTPLPGIPKTFFDLAREPVPPVGPVTAEGAALQLHIDLAASVGVAPSYREWLGMGWEERHAWLAAADRARGIAAQLGGLAAMGPLGAALAGAEADGGAAAESVFLTRQVDAALASIEKEMEEARVP